MDTTPLPALVIEGPFGPSGYAVAVTKIETCASGDYYVEGIRTDRGEATAAHNPTGEVAFIWPAQRIRVLTAAVR